MLKACLQVLVGNASSLLSVCPYLQIKEFNAVVYRGCRLVIVIGKVPTANRQDFELFWSNIYSESTQESALM